MSANLPQLPPGILSKIGRHALANNLKSLLDDCVANLNQCDQLLDQFADLKNAMGIYQFNNWLQDRLIYAIDHEDNQMVDATLMVMTHFHTPTNFRYQGMTPYQFALMKNNNSTLSVLNRYGLTQ